MKIAYVYDNIYPYHIGGAEKRLWELAKRLAQKGHEVTLFGMKHWEGKAIIYSEGVRLWGVCPPQDLYVNGRRSIKQAIYFGWKVLSPLLGERFDIIDCHNSPYFPCFSAKLCAVVKRTPLIITWLEVWGDYWFEYLGKKGIFGWIVERLTAKLTNENLAISERTKGDLGKLGVRDIKVIPCGIDFQGISRVNPSNESSHLIFGGRLIKEKNVDFLIKAVSLVKKEVPNINCVIVGDGPERRALEELTTDLKLNDNIKFTGFLEDHNELISYMKASKVFVFPSEREGFGIVVVEANACGLPVIVIGHSRNAACDLVIDGQTGFICQLSEEGIAEKMSAVLAEQSSDIRARCINHSQEYDWPTIVNSVEGIYAQLIKNGGRRDYELKK